MNSDVQIPVLPLGAQLPDVTGVPGCWSAGERCLAVGERDRWVTVWFHFFEGGEAILSLRADDEAPSRVHGRWWVEADQLVVSFSHRTIRASFRLREEVLEWAGETLLRLPDQMASLPFGIPLPYHVTFGSICLSSE